MAMSPTPIITHDYDLIGSFTLDRVERYPALTWRVDPVRVYRAGPFSVVATEDRDSDTVHEIIAFVPDAAPTVPYNFAGSRILDASTLVELATIVDIVDDPVEPLEGAVYVLVSDPLAVGASFVLEPMNEFGEFIALLANGPQIRRYAITAETTEGVDLLTQLLGGIGFDYVKAVLQEMGSTATDGEILAGIQAAAAIGENVQAAIVRRMESLVAAHLSSPVPGLQSR